MEFNPNEPTTEDRLPWHKPEVQQLVINLDTGRKKIGSLADGDFVDGRGEGDST
jgi:hypothetical protein